MARAALSVPFEPATDLAPSDGCGALLRAGSETFALRHLSSGLAGPANRFALFARTLLRWLFVGAPTLHLAEQAFALQLLLQRPERLVDIVVTNEDLQGTSPFGSAFDVPP
jgi:hypothetical protein